MRKSKFFLYTEKSIYIYKVFIGKVTIKDWSSRKALLHENISLPLCLYKILIAKSVHATYIVVGE